MPYFILAILIIIFLCTHSPNLEGDAPYYIKFAQTRPPLYPIFIWLFHWAGSYQLSLVAWVQGILTFLALLYARHWLRKNLQVSDFSFFLVCLWIILTISFHFQIENIQSEGLSFPFFIWTFFLLIECFQKFNLRKLIFLALWVSVLVLTRLQFYYFYGIFLILCIWYLWQRIPIRKLGMGALILFGSMFLTFVIDHSYHYIKHGFFGGASYGGLLFLVQTLYLADSNAANYFKNPIEKTYVQSMINQRNTEHFNKDAELISMLKPTYYDYAYQSYARNQQALITLIEKTLEVNDVNRIKSNVIAIDINQTLFLHASKINLLFLLWKFVRCMGGIPQFLFFLILLLALPIKIVRDKLLQPDLSLLFIIVITLITFCNAAIIAVCNPDLPVYFCYSQFMFYCLGAFLINQVINESKKL